MSCNCQEVAERGKEKIENSLAMKLLKNYAKKIGYTVEKILGIF